MLFLADYPLRLTLLQDIKPRIYMADSDFDAITNNGAICNSLGNVGPKEFCEIMTKEIRLGWLVLSVC
jgi:hypothetical protein